ncbi:hypothetical protein [Treponema pedis]|nr:hypothetical protein [Treponema pedis]
MLKNDRINGKQQKYLFSEDLIYNALGRQQCTAIAFLKHETKIIAKE